MPSRFSIVFRLQLFPNRALTLTISLGGKLKTRSAKRGFTIIEVLLDAVVITMVFGAIVGSFLLMLRTVNYGKIRTSATALANEQIETLRNMPYNLLATKAGTILPQGTIDDQATITRNGASLVLKTRIIYIDDPFDGCAIAVGNNFECTDGQLSSTQDTIPVDYKRITVEVAEASNQSLVLAKLSTNASGKAAETESDTGMLLLRVVNSQGLPIEGALVTITHPTLQVSLTGYSNAQGYVFIANMPPDLHNGYHIVVTKEGYSSDYTTPRTSQNPNQVQPDISIYPQQITSQTLVIDLLATMQVTLKNELGSPLPNVQVVATSSKVTQFNPSVPKQTYARITDANGVANFSNIEWDSYSLAATNYRLVSTSPYQPVILNPSATLPVILTVTANMSWPRIDKVTPSSGTVGSNTTILIEGASFPSSSGIFLRKAGEVDRSPTSYNVATNEKSITATFNLTGIAVGAWDIIIISNGQQTIQYEGFIIS